MPSKRKRPEQVPPAPAHSTYTRRATRQTPVLPPQPPTCAANRVVVVAQAPAGAGPTLTPRRASQPQPKPTAAGSTASLSPATSSDTSTHTTIIAAGAPMSSQTPVPIPTPPGLSAARIHHVRPQTAVPPPLIPLPSAPVQTPVPVPAVVAPLRPPSSITVGTRLLAGQGMSGAAAVRGNSRPCDLVAPEITYHVPQSPVPGRIKSSLLRPHGPSAPPPRLDGRPNPAPPPVVTPVLPPKPPTLAVNDRGPHRADRNIDKVVLGDLCFRTWYPSYYGKEVLGDGPGHARHGGGSKEGGQQDASSRSFKRDKDAQPMLERLYVCPSCFKYAKELVAWRGHVRVCQSTGFVPGKKVYAHPRGRRRVLVAHSGQGPGPKRRRGDGVVRHAEEIVQDEGEWSIWEVDGEKNGLFCQNLSLFAKLFLDNKSVFFDVSGFNYFLLVYTPPAKPLVPRMESLQSGGHPPQVTGFFSKEKMSWDNNNLACILVFPPWQRKGLGALLIGASYEISRREGILGGPEKPISDLGKKGYKRFWSGEISRWLLGLDVAGCQVQGHASPVLRGEAQMPARREDGGPAQEVVMDVNDCSQGTWIGVEDCLSVLREMGVVEDAGLGYGKPGKVEDAGLGYGKPGKVDDGEEMGKVDEQGADMADASGGEKQEAGCSRSSEDGKTAEAAAAPPRLVPRVRIDKEAVRRYVATHRISLERTCDPDGFAEGYAMRGGGECRAAGG